MTVAGATPGTDASAASIASAAVSIASSVGPFTLTPMGARMPDWSITSRVLIGCSLGALVVPTSGVALTISAQMSSAERM